MNAAPATAEPILDARTGPGAYVALASIWFVLAACYLFLALTRPGSGTWPVVGITSGVGALWIVWLRGFRLRVTARQIEYRNGFYRTVVIPSSEIADAQHVWVESSPALGVRVPRLVVGSRQGESTIINSKVFRGRDLRILIDAVKKTAGRP